ncbi:MAG: TonB-dependent receptor domain-containing protein [Oceanicaulis sp.]
MNRKPIRQAVGLACCAASLSIAGVKAGATESDPDTGRASENVITLAQDAFGTSIGNETIGLYSASNVRWFSPVEAGNLRIEGLYFDQRGGLVGRVLGRSAVRVGLAAQSYPLPAPTGIVDYTLRPAASRPLTSLVTGIGDYGGYYAELDASAPLTPTLSVNAGVALAHREYVSGSNIWFLDTGLITRWRPDDDTALTAFFSRYDYWDQEASPVFLTAQGLPPPLPRRRYVGQPWAQWEGRAQNIGALAEVRRGAWRLDAGVFGSEFTQDKLAIQLFTGIDASGMGERLVLSGVDQFSRSISGEARLTREWLSGPVAHRAFASIRGRNVAAEFGGFDVQPLGPGSIFEQHIVPEPDRSFGPLDRDEQRQLAGAGGWAMIWPGRMEASAGLQHVRYEKTALPASGGALTAAQNSWLWNGSAAVNVTARLVAYAGVSRGLEDSGVAPNTAVNRGQPLPALITAQRDAGVRYQLSGTISLLAGWFEIEKPYFAINPDDGVFRAVGDVVHSGVELSLTGEIADGLTLVAGAVLLDPRVRGPAVESGLVQPRPLARPDVSVTANLDYRIPAHRALSLDVSVRHTGRQAASTVTDISLPARTIVDAGFRYRLDLSGRPAALRVQWRNLGDVDGLNVSSGGSFGPIDSRRAVASLTVDF